MTTMEELKAATIKLQDAALECQPRAECVVYWTVNLLRAIRESKELYATACYALVAHKTTLEDKAFFTAIAQNNPLFMQKYIDWLDSLIAIPPINRIHDLAEKFKAWLYSLPDESDTRFYDEAADITIKEVTLVYDKEIREVKWKQSSFVGKDLQQFAPAQQMSDFLPVETTE